MSESSFTPSRTGSPIQPPPEPQPAPQPFRFNWDSGTRKGPGSVSETTEGRGGDYFASGATVRLDGLLNASTTSLALGALPPDWSSSKHGFHAISTVLNNPHKRGAPPKAHSSLPPVPATELPRVRRKDFDSYLKAIAPEWESFERNMSLSRGDEAPGMLRRSSVTLPPLDAVPEVFFKPHFNLGDPQTFALVTEQDSSLSQSPSSSPTTLDFGDPTSLSHSLPLLDKLSHYTDTLEAHLTHEISLRSTSFFAALTNLQDLQSESTTCLSRISQLRGLLQEVDQGTARRGVEGVRRELKKDRLGVVKEGVKRMGDVWDMLGIGRGLVEAGQWEEALGVVDSLWGLWESLPREPSKPSAKSLPSLPEEESGSSLDTIHEFDYYRRSPSGSGSRESASPPPAIPLSSLHAFSSLPDHLQDLTFHMASSLTTELVTILRVDLLTRIDSDSATPSADQDLGLRDQVRPLLSGLMRAKGKGKARDSGPNVNVGAEEFVEPWREAVLTEVKSTVKRHLPPGLDLESLDLQITTPASENDSSSAFATHIRSMTHEQYLAFSKAVFGSLLNCVEGVRNQNAVVVELVETMQPRPSPKPLSTNFTSTSLSPQIIQNSLSELLVASAELANIVCANILALRSEQHSKLDLPQFVELFDITWNFVVSCEVVCRRMIVNLRGAAVTQAKGFLQSFHQLRISQSAKLVEDEQWVAADVASSMQRIVDTLVDCAVRDPTELQLKRLEPGSPPSRSPSINGPSSPKTSPSQSNGTAISKHLRIEDRQYFAVSATLETLILLVDYLKLIVNLSMLTTDAMSRVIEFLKAFNSRTCQVVLGAGAMRSAGLKNITARHLALASQSLSIMIALVPYVRETFRRHLNPKQAVMLVEFDKLKRDFQEHQNEIHAKLIAIMGDRLTAHIRTLQTINWETIQKGAGLNGYMELLIKETVTLHKVLSRYLSPQVVEYVMTQVFAAINHRLSEEFTKIDLPSLEAKERLVGDAQYLHERLSSLKNVGAPSNMLETVAMEKSIRSQSSPSLHHDHAPGSTANQRIKNMFARSAVKPLELDKPLPSPTPSPLPVPPHSNGVPEKDVPVGVDMGISQSRDQAPSPMTAPIPDQSPASVATAS
ncbi:hypothetical protein JAAARDRAFT_709192 [Jaapia argillacea MUCL 33604]|uniref:Vacuolar protein sorting-associated protein 54 C-terminal domain-containing protein n=1 Tax=Jaapia argillacea MUCL 33604 TaxID=933084 RepID=A0A067Q1P3_9AGAM|nr:hypothetical protein JAAARDRAFT_709192 [Jaapia argillacea MUCL 33604]